MANQVEVRLTKDRISKELTVDEFILLQEGNLRAAKSVMGKFIIGADGNYLSADQGASLVGKMSVESFMEFLDLFKEQMKDIVPSPNSAA